MPHDAINKLIEERERLESQAPRPGETTLERKIRENKAVFMMTDQFLDQAAGGPVHLKDPRAAWIVEESILFGAAERSDLFAWCVMAIAYLLVFVVLELEVYR